MAKKPIQKKSKKAAKKAGGRRKKGKRSYKSYSGVPGSRVSGGAVISAYAIAPAPAPLCVF